MVNRNCRAPIGPSVCLWAALIGLTGCSTTQSIVFSAPDQPAGEYQYAVISATAFGKTTGSVLQRFYEQYPPDQYTVIACEAQNKNYLPLIGGLGGLLLGALIAVPAAYDAADKAEDEYTGLGIAGAGIGVSVTLGYFIGDAFKTKYVVTYVEREPAQRGQAEDAEYVE